MKDTLDRTFVLEQQLAAERAKAQAEKLRADEAHAELAGFPDMQAMMEKLRSKLDAAEAVVRAAQEMSQAIYNEEAKQTWLISKPLRFHEAINNLRAALSRQEGTP
jgi:hypothetical protein